MASRIQLRRGAAAAWTAVNPILAEGEPGYETDTRKIKTGNGLSHWVSLPYTVTGGGAVGSVTSDEASAISAQAASAISVMRNSISVLSQAISVISQQVSVLSQAHSVLSQQVSVLSTIVSNEASMRSQSVSVASAAATSADNHASIASAAATSVNARVTSVNLALSAFSARSAGISTHGLQSIIDALSNKISGINNISNTLSQEISVRSVLSDRVTSISAQLTSIEAHVNTASNALSVHSQLVSTWFGAGQIRVIATDQSITASVFTNISGLSLSVTSLATYDIRGKVLWTTSATQSVAFGFTYPAGVAPGAMHMFAFTSVFTAGFGDNFVSTAGITRGYINETGMSTVATAQLSISAVSAGGTYMVKIEGLIRTGGTAGTVQLQVAGGTTPVQLFLLQGSYLQAYRIQ
jgi:Major tropism determinant N-terminal domain